MAEIVITNIEIMHACLPEERNPDEQSAVLEFAQRASRLLDSADRKVMIHALNEDSVVFLNSPSTVCVFLVSCGPDGSVHRNVRKFIKKLKERAPTTNNNNDSSTYCIALLGHSVCKTSAEQMAEQVFGQGRRMAKAFGVGVPLVGTLEAQVELMGPEEAFDGWIQSLGDVIRQQYKEDLRLTSAAVGGPRNSHSPNVVS